MGRKGAVQIMAKTAYGSGTIERTDSGKWRIRIYLGRDPETGKPRRRSRNVSGTKAQAYRAMKEMREEWEAEQEAARHGDRVTLGEYAWQFYYADYARRENKVSAERDKYIVRKIDEHFGTTPIGEVTPAQIRAEHTRIRMDGAMSEHSIHKMHQKMKQIMLQAVYDELIPKNPCDPVKAPRPKSKERKSLSREEAARLYAILVDGPLEAPRIAVLLGLATGMRMGEVLGLQWKNVDLDAGAVYVNQQLSRSGELRDPKTERSKRWLHLNDTTRGVLRAWKVEQARQLQAIDESNMDALITRGADTDHYEHIVQDSDTPVVTNGVGGFTESTWFGKWFRNFCVDYDFGTYGKVEAERDAKGILRYKRTHYQGLTFHELRHTQATLLIGSGADIKTVQNRLGHSSASLTMNIYAHAIRQNDEIAAKTIEGILARGTKKTSAEVATSPVTDDNVAAADAPDGSKPFLCDEDKVVELFEGLPDGAELSRKEIAEHCGITSEKKARELVRRLVDEDVLTKHGKTKGARYLYRKF